jgi:16S rRNA (guanine1207-N2)-methyltransferase
VVCNPPFHQDRTVGDTLAWRMFAQAHRALAPGGELRVVGNRHLDHGRRLMRIFGHAARLATTGGYEVLLATRR